MDNLNNYLTSIQQEIIADNKTVKVAKLIILLIKIEKELNTVKSNLLKLKKQQQYVYNLALAEQVNQKIATVEQLLNKIRKARLNLNYYFI
ncbi:chromosome segregation protein SMC [Pleurocapsales cyanobacterium LEGE 06147]|nr:chromosome segregation protein SMC [Pleurocapsales cyanobacterium LEGE 06147]